MLDEYLNEMLSICATEFGVTIIDVCSGSKKQELVFCRKAFCIVVKEFYDVKLEAMARKLNKSINGVCRLVTSQPDNRYYNSCLKRIRMKTKKLIEFEKN